MLRSHRLRAKLSWSIRLAALGALPLLAAGLGGCPDTPTEPPPDAAPAVVVVPATGAWRDLATCPPSALLPVPATSRTHV